MEGRYLILEYAEPNGWFVGFADDDKTDTLRGFMWARDQGRHVVFVDTQEED